MRRPSFGVVTGVVTVLAVLGFLSKLLVGSIPQGPENRLAAESSEFLLQASHELIDWHTLTEETFALARKQDKPIMLVVGSACSATGRSIDKNVFTSKEVRGTLARYFISARVDTMERPEFVNAFWPITRAIIGSRGRLAIPPDFQVWFIDPGGHAFMEASQNVAGEPLDSKAFLADLTRANARYDRVQQHPGASGEDQRSDLAALGGPLPSLLPDLTAYANDLSAASPSDVGGFPVNGFQRLWPEAWRLQLLAGRLGEYRRSINPCLASPTIDLLDGGFFTDAAKLDWRGIGFDKLTVTNADMLETLALGAVMLGDDRERWLALQTFDSLAGELLREGFVVGGRIGDEDLSGRSARSSFSPRRLRELFPDDADREWTRKNLGLKVESNALMTPMLAQPDLPMRDPTRFNASLSVLRKSQPDAKYAGPGQLDVGAYAAARMMRAALVLGDEDRLFRAEGIFERLDEFRTLDDVIHSHSAGNGSHAYLGDYLAYADGSLQDFLATGNEEVLKNGVAVLRRALFLYGTNTKGVYVLSQPSGPLSPQDIAAPEIVDNLRESCSAQIIRLCQDYGRLLGSDGVDLGRIAGEVLVRFAPLSKGLGQFAAGYSCAAANMRDPRFAIALGPRRVQVAARLARLVPTCLSAPAGVIVKLPKTEPGIYIVGGAQILGPMSVENAARTLRSVPF